MCRLFLTVRKRASILILALLPLMISAQESPVERDIFFWGYYDLSFELHKKWSIDFKNQIRLNENATRFDYTAADLGVSYEAARWLDLNVTYRYSLKNHWRDGWRHSHQFRGNVSLTYRLGDFRFYNRNRFQTGMDDSFDLSEVTDDFYYRNRSRVKYDINKQWDVYAYFEPYFKIGPIEANERRIHRTRTSVGVNYELNSRESIRLFFVHDEQIRRGRPSHRYFIGFGYSRDIKLN